ncbi:hypothetical protein CAPTEDRAFT_192923 [Capitella teleta]|uniref:DUF7789 domain-containing protein n=1 Tax=Capitella teleta TaxID=283909 RepID=R7V811_CAPTE|nr:hypothetical protein CAPTEDRAFT_192923 [Capitella teleta]|eukprot:ELU11895.1 hypothetical protein CAPTEDRAFT_192923 [Capitella teleta]
MTSMDSEGAPIETVPQVTPSVSRVRPTLLFGKRKAMAALMKKERIFMALSVINLLLVLSLTAYRLHIVVASKQTAQSDFTFAVMLLVNSVFCFVYVFNGILREREFEIYAYVAAVLVVFAYCVLEYAINSDPDTGRTLIKLASHSKIRLIFVCILGPVNIGFAIYIAREFGFLEFRIVGASEYLQMMYHLAALYQSLLKFDLQLTWSLVILVLHNGAEMELLEKIIIGVGIPFSLFWTVLGWAIVRYELCKTYIVFSILGFVQPAYVIFKLVDVYEALTGGSKETLLASDRVVLYVTLVAIAFSIIIRFALFVESIRCRWNFGKGLKERAFDVENERSRLLSKPRQRYLI